MGNAARSVLLIGSLVALFSLSGCAANLYSGGPSVAGMLYTGVRDPAQHLAVALDATASGRKVGKSSAQAILGLVAFGDAGVDAAMKAGGITKVHHVDHEVQLAVGGLWEKQTTIVYGE